MPPAKRSRVYLTLSQEKLEQLEWWADKERRPLANLATFLVENAINAEIESGRLKIPSQDPAPNNDQLLEVANLLAKLLDGKKLTTKEEESLAGVCNRPPHSVHNASRRIREEDDN